MYSFPRLNLINSFKTYLFLNDYASIIQAQYDSNVTELKRDPYNQQEIAFFERFRGYFGRIKSK